VVLQFAMILMKWTYKMNNLEKEYTDFYLKGEPLKSYPNEYVVRVFLGTYPNLSLDKNYVGKKFLDVGMGDGRNLRFMVEKGFDAYGIEISEEICSHVRRSFQNAGIKANIKVGKNDSIPFDDSFFDYLVSWNSSYYMGNYNNYYSYKKNVEEFYRVIAPKGILVISIPTKSNFIFENSVEIGHEYKKIVNDPYKIRNGQIFKCFSDSNSIIKEFQDYFENFKFAELNDNCFGQKNNYIIMVCNKK